MMLTDIVGVKIAVLVCNSALLKSEIFCLPDTCVEKQLQEISEKFVWLLEIERVSRFILNGLVLPEPLWQFVLPLVGLIGRGMLVWAKYNENVFFISREVSMKGLSYCCFSQDGKVNKKRAARALLNCKTLSIEQKYRLSCIYCFTDEMACLFRELTREKAAASLKVGEHLQIVKFWSCYLMGETDQFELEGTLDEYRLKSAIRSGSKAAVEYCLTKQSNLVNAALEAVKLATEIPKDEDFCCFGSIMNPYYVPKEYYVDIVLFLVLQMDEEEKVNFLWRDIGGIHYAIGPNESIMYSRVLGFLLKWPYQNYFMPTANLMWDFLPENNYAFLLLKISGKITSWRRELRYFDYRNLLRCFWQWSTEHLKRYVLSNQAVIYLTETSKFQFNACTGFLTKLAKLDYFIHENRDIIRLILTQASDMEKQNIFSSGVVDFQNLVILRHFGTLEFLLSFTSPEQAKRFKKNLCFNEETMSACSYFLFRSWCLEEPKEVDAFINWTDLSEIDVAKLKHKMIYSQQGKKESMFIILYRDKPNDTFIKWFLPETDPAKFKKYLIFGEEGVNGCARLLREGRIETLNDFVNYCIPSREDVEQLKKSVAYIKGFKIFETLFLDYECDDDWQEMEIFLTWCFAVEGEIAVFKEFLLAIYGIEIHLRLLRANEWRQIETFFAWLGLSRRGISVLKSETLISYDMMDYLRDCLFHSYDEDFPDYPGGKWEAVELPIRWCLTDQETAFLFKEEFAEFCRKQNEHVGHFNDFANIWNALELLLNEIAGNL